jgi:hypothetical protein
MSETTEENPKKVDEVSEDATVVSNETLPAVAGEDDVAEVFFDDYQDGVTGVQLAEQAQAQIFKLDHKKGKFHSLDDDEERFDYLDCVIVRARSYYRRFGPSGVACESDNGIKGYDSELKKELDCAEGSCEFSYHIKGQLQGKCGLGLSLQIMAMLDGVATPIQMNMSKTSAMSFAKYVAKLNRQKKKIQEVTTRIGARYIKGKYQTYYAGDFKVADDEPCVDVSGMLGEEGEQQKV